MTWLGYPPLGFPRYCYRSESQTHALINHTDTHLKLRQHSNQTQRYIFSSFHILIDELKRDLLDPNNSVGHNYCRQIISFKALFYCVFLNKRTKNSLRALYNRLLALVQYSAPCISHISRGRTIVKLYILHFLPLQNNILQLISKLYLLHRMTVSLELVVEENTLISFISSFIAHPSCNRTLVSTQRELKAELALVPVSVSNMRRCIFSQLYSYRC